MGLLCRSASTVLPLRLVKQLVDLYVEDFDGSARRRLTEMRPAAVRSRVETVLNAANHRSGIVAVNFPPSRGNTSGQRICVTASSDDAWAALRARRLRCVLDTPIAQAWGV
jgi:hypothetical protein